MHRSLLRKAPARPRNHVHQPSFGTFVRIVETVETSWYVYMEDILGELSNESCREFATLD